MDATDQDQCGSDLWLDDVNGASFFYCDIPPMPDFPCMSSSSSSSSTPAPVKATAGSSSTASTASSSSSAASWAVIKSEGEEDNKSDQKKSCDDNFQQQTVEAPPPSGTLSSTASMELIVPQQNEPNIDQGMDDCMDVMENLSYIDHLLDSNDFFDPSSIFQQNCQSTVVPEDQQFEQEQSRRQEEGIQTETDPKPNSSEDLASVFLEWLKMNKDSVSAEDLRKVKIKKSTIECAARRLGGGREAMKQLLKLILEWVQTNHLQKRRLKLCNNNTAQFININPNPNAVPNLIPPATTSSDLINPCQTPCSWVPHPAYGAPDPRTGFHQQIGYMGDPFPTQSPYQSPPDNYQHVMDCVPTWQQPAPQFPAVPHHFTSFPDNSFVPPSFPMYSNKYPYHFPPSDQQSDQRLARLGSSATKEARKKRMARQRRFTSHHRNNHHHSNCNSQGPTPNQTAEFVGTENAGALTAPPANWVYWQSVAAGSGGMTTAAPKQTMLGSEAHAPVMQAAPVQPVNYQAALPDRRQGLMKTEKNLRFLLQKVLKQSDVGNLGRIVLPKKEAETHLPELEARDGISMAMEDIGTSRVWNMRYRFWPNNKSRMYLLENTGEFVRANGLQEGDFIVIYSDVKCGKYLIRGVKVRQSGTPPPKLPETSTKRTGKAQRNQHSNSPAPVNNNPSSQTLVIS